MNQAPAKECSPEPEPEPLRVHRLQIDGLGSGYTHEIKLNYIIHDIFAAFFSAKANLTRNPFYSSYKYSPKTKLDKYCI